jgi:hypothetical protein
MVCTGVMVRINIVHKLGMVIDRPLLPVSLSPQAISSGMLRRPPTNLNQQSQEATILLIREVIASGIQLSEAINLFGLYVSLKCSHHLW